MRSRSRTAALKSATADLFAVVPAAAQPAPVLGVPSRPLPQVRTPAQPKQLWYAVVFPELQEPHGQSDQAASLQRLCLSAQRFTPLVSIDMPNALLLEIRGSVQLFGSLAALQTAIESAWSGLSLRVRSATAPTALAALWCARAGKAVCLEDAGQLAGALADLPIAATSWDLVWQQTLRAMGVTRIGDLLRLPRAGVARRLSPAAVRDLDIALARQAAPRRIFVPRQRFRERCDFETEIETAAYLQKALEPLVGRCAQFLRGRQAGIQAMELRLHHRALPVTRVPVGLASITSERRRLADVLDERLQRLELSAPVRSLQLLSGTLLPLSAESLDVFAGMRAGGAQASEAAPQLVERLRARLGAAAVYGVRPIAEHRPEAAWQRVHELRLTAVGGAGQRIGMPRPVWLLEGPVLLAAQDLETGRGVLTLEEGPERIESGWWDGKDVSRDYYVARRSRGARWWIFQERRTHHWYLHGVFA